MNGKFNLSEYAQSLKLYAESSISWYTVQVWPVAWELPDIQGGATGGLSVFVLFFINYPPLPNISPPPPPTRLFSILYCILRGK